MTTPSPLTRWMLNIDAPPFWLKNMRDKFPGFEGKVDRWQIITFRGPVHDLHRRRRGQGRHRCARRRPQPGRQRLRHEHHHARKPTGPATTSGRSCATTAWTASCITTQLRDGVHGVFGEDEAMLQGPAGGHRRQPGLRVLQPQHRRRRHVGPPPDRAACWRPKAVWLPPPSRQHESQVNRHGSNKHRSLAARNRVVAVSRSPTGIHRIVLEPSLPKKAEPGSHIDVMVTHRRRARRSAPTRSWSPTPTATRLAISVLKAPAVPGRIGLHAHAAAGRHDWKSPSRCRTSRCGSGAERYILLAGGIGITAIANMAAVLQASRPTTRWSTPAAAAPPWPIWTSCSELHGDRLRSTSTTREPR